MALFKILRGKSTDLDNQPFHDGYAYFTPDDGRFYIDVQLDTVPGYYISRGTENGKNIYRIEIESKTWAELNNTKISVGDHIDASQINNLQNLTLTAGTNSFIYDGQSADITVDLQADWETADVNSSTYIKNKPTIINVAITVDDAAKTLFITSPVTNGDGVSY